MKIKKYILGIDIGATLVKIGLVNKKAKLIYKTSFNTKAFNTKNAFLDKIKNEARFLINKAGISARNLFGIGIGAPGTVDYKKGIVHILTNIRGWREVPLKQIMQNAFGTRVVVDNDANAFACGQLKWGQARNIKNAICVTLGTGVGGGLIINGEIFRGSNYSAGEIGHICIDMNGPKCGCGNKGCLEAFVGNKYIVNRLVKRMKTAGPKFMLNRASGELSKITPKIITEAAQKKDPLALQIWKETGLYLGIGLAGLVNALNPEAIIIGGGVSKAGKFLFPYLKSQLYKNSMKQHLKILKIIKASFVDEAPIIGAASLIIK